MNIYTSAGKQLHSLLDDSGNQSDASWLILRRIADDLKNCESEKPFEFHAGALASAALDRRDRHRKHSPEWMFWHRQAGTLRKLAALD